MKSAVILTLSLLLDFAVTGQLFFNVAPSMGIHHSVNTNLQFGGNGVSFFDYDNDGWDDLTFVQENDDIVFFRNVNGQFNQQSYISGPNETRQVLWVDYDNDGDYDLFQTATNGQAKLFKHNGNFIFTDVSSTAGLSPFNTNNFGVSFADYDRDGFLDFYLARYKMDGNVNDPTHTNALYHNNGNGTFTNVTTLAGVGDSIQPSFEGIWIDINKDLWPDLYVINDRVLWGNSLYLNNGDGTFTDITSSSGAEMFGQDPMSATFEDFDNDLDLDILCANGGPPTKPIRLFKNNSNNTFTEIAGSIGIATNEVNHCTWGATWFDADNDSRKDLYIATGLLTLDASNETRSYLFMNNGNGFVDSPGAFQNNHVAASYGVAKGDIENNGYADIVVQNAKNFESFLWKNKTNMQVNNKWVKVSLEGVISNRMAIGSWIYVYTPLGTYTHYTRCGENFASQSSQHYIFGLGAANKIDSIIIHFPSGVVDKYEDLFVNQHYEFIEGGSLSNEIAFTGPTTFCSGDSIVLDGGDFDSYLWNTGDTTRYLTVTSSGNYFVTSPQMGFNVQSNTVTINVIDNPVIQNLLTHPLCFNDNSGEISLNVTTNASSYVINWSNGQTGLVNSGLNGGVYYYDFIDNGGCTATDTFTLFDTPAMTVFHQEIDNGGIFDVNFIVTGGTAPYSVTLNGVSGSLINSGLAPGVYTIIITDAHGCAEELVLTLGNPAGVSENNLDIVSVYPNPSRNGRFTITGVDNLSSIKVFDEQGRAIEFLLDNDSLILGTAAEGVYLLYIEDGLGSKVAKLVIR